MGRRKIFSGQDEDKEVPEKKPAEQPSWGASLANQESPPPNAAPAKNEPSEVLDLMLLKPTKKKSKLTRNRDWDRQHPPKTYRLVPTEVKDAVKELAKLIDTPISQTANLLLEVGDSYYEDGEIKFDVSVGPRGLTAYPSSDEPTRPKLSWKKTHAGSPPKKKRKGRKRTDSLWKQQVTYRLTDAVIARITQIAGIHKIPEGEVVRAFLERAIAGRYAGEWEENKEV